MEGLIPLLILFFVINTISKAFKKAKPGQQKPMTQQQVEATKARAAAVKPTPKPAARHDDYRFPAKAKPVVKSELVREGREGGVVNTAFTPLTVSQDRSGTNSAYTGGVSQPSPEGNADMPEGLKPVPDAYRTEAGSSVAVLPLNFSRSTLVQAVVMSEILKRPRASR